MKAIGIQNYGGPEALQRLELPIPQPGPQEVLVRVKAAGVNPVDSKIRRGILKDRMPNEFPIVLGWDAAGVVESVGSEHGQYKIHDEVMAYCRKDAIHDGSYGEYLVLESRHLARKPKNLSFEEASTIPLAGLTAYQSLFEGNPLQSGQTILVHAGAGGVGGYAIQLAKQAGATVLTTARSGSEEELRKLGADAVIDYSREDFVAAVRKQFPAGIDAVFDTVGGETQIRSADVLRPGGELTTLLYLDPELFKGRDIVARYVFVRPDAEQLNKLKDFAEHGQLKVRLTECLPLDEARLAHEKIDTGRTHGKIALRIE